LSEPERDPDALVDEDELALVTDLYQLTMLETYFEHGQEGPAAFELFYRSLPETRNYVVAAGSETALRFLERLHFAPSAIAALQRTGLFKPPFLAHLARWSFTGDVWAVPEGTPVFPGEPLLQVIAPLPQAQFVETLLMNVVHFQTLIASKAARITRAARGRPVVDFGLRRAHGIEAGMWSVRAGFIAGIESAANVLAGMRYAIPIRGTMAHSAIEAFGDDLTAFRAFAKTQPRTICLVDTFDTLAGVDAVVRLARELGERFEVRGIRLDSGDFLALSNDARARLDAAGLEKVTIFASGGLDEHSIERLVAAGAPIDGFGVGTSLDSSIDAPVLDMAYKLVEYDGKPRLKLSTGKRLLPGRKQVFRVLDAGGRAEDDVLALHDETLPGRALLRPVMREGRRLAEARRPLAELREQCANAVAELPERLHSLGRAEPYPVLLSSRLSCLADTVEAEVRARLRG
jgi:nicotinate phosphoribosyltransferase